MDVNDWDLQAVVRSCCSSSAAAASSPDPFSFFPQGDGDGGGGGGGIEALFNSLSDVSLEASSSFYELEELCRPFIIRPSPLIPPLPLQPSSSNVVPHRPQHQRKAPRQSPEATRSRKRKNQQKKVVCQVAVDGASADPWAWRKYGQKPIKGSPYPRGYYRCSSSKGCPARKQVERSREDPGALTITYTAEHNHPIPTHRSSLAGSTRHKPPLPPPSTCHQSPPENLSPMTPLTASMEDVLLRKGEDAASEDEDDGGELLTVEDMEVVGEDGDVLFMDLGGPTSGGGAAGLFASPWLAGGYQAAAAAAGGG